MTTVWHALLLALLVAGCSATAPSPQPVYVTPPPLPANVLLSLSGVASLNSATFDAPATYAVDYTYDCSGKPAYMLAITAERKDGSHEELLHLGPATGSGTTFGHGAGSTYLEVSISCPWTITVRRS